MGKKIRNACGFGRFIYENVQGELVEDLGHFVDVGTKTGGRVEYSYAGVAFQWGNDKQVVFYSKEYREGIRLPKTPEQLIYPGSFCKSGHMEYIDDAGKLVVLSDVSELTAVVKFKGGYTQSISYLQMSKNGFSAAPGFLSLYGLGNNDMGLSVPVWFCPIARDGRVTRERLALYESLAKASGFYFVKVGVPNTDLIGCAIAQSLDIFNYYYGLAVGSGNYAEVKNFECK